jgi:ribosomal protein S18 acetylase RimI-like enzyme
MPNEPTIRTATMDDFSAVDRLLHELDDHHVRIRPDVFRPFNGPTRPRELIARFIDEDDGELFLAEVGNDIVGLATIQITDSPDAPMFRPRQNAIIDNLVVNQEFQRLGVGKRLLDCAVEWTRSRKIPRIDINVWIDNKTSLSFFTANGFTPMCQRMELRIDKAK